MSVSNSKSGIVPVDSRLLLDKNAIISATLANQGGAITMNRCLMLLGTLAISLVAAARHSPNVHLDRGDIVEISGRLAEIQWQNPHTLLIRRHRSRSPRRG